MSEKVKKITWMQRKIDKRDLASFLTANNFQPGKFNVVEVDAFNVFVVFVKKEEEL